MLDADERGRCPAKGGLLTGSWPHISRSELTMAALELPNLTPEEMSEMRAAFDIMDENKDGEITVKELSELIKSYGMFASDEEIKESVARVDLDKNGTVDFEEFVIMMNQRLGSGIPDQEIVESFAKFDRNGDGFISADELLLAFQQMGECLTPTEVQALIDEVDTDNDGRLSYEEFRWMMLNDPRKTTHVSTSGSIVTQAVTAVLQRAPNKNPNASD